ncbi:MAG TPA: hypothetical protein DGT23_05040 [Micromonosporaceae bacterium]|nr:hypothetical protein [Micromonosporaceae bacterium]
MARRTPVTIAVVAALAVALGLLVPRAVASQRAQRDMIATWIAPGPPELGFGSAGQAGVAAVSVNFAGDFLGWAMLDRTTGNAVGHNLEQTSSTESMIKAWLVADFLRRAAENQVTPTPDELDKAREAIKWSDDNAAEDLYVANGGNQSVQRMISTCAMTDTTVYDNWWSRTQMSPLDAVRLGECLMNGKAAGPVWTQWLLGEMRAVAGGTAPTEQQETRGGGRWGIIDGVPASEVDSVAIKNGWTAYGSDNNWHLNCLAVSDNWAMSVMMRYPSEKGLDYGAEICATVARQLLA